MRLIREADMAATGGAPRYHIVCSNTNAHAAAFLSAHEYAVEPSGLTGHNYVEWCLEFCRERGITIFWPGKEAGLIGSARRSRHDGVFDGFKSDQVFKIKI